VLSLTFVAGVGGRPEARLCDRTRPSTGSGGARAPPRLDGRSEAQRGAPRPPLAPAESSSTAVPVSESLEPCAAGD